MVAVNPVGCKAEDSVMVTLHPLPVVDFGTFDTTICQGNTIILDAGNPGSTYSWNSGQMTQTISVSSPALYVATVTDVNGCSGIGAIRVNTEICTGIDALAGIEVKAYPNPKEGKFQLELQGKLGASLTLLLTNSPGQVLYQEKFSQLNDSFKQQLDLSKYAAGIYYLRIETEKGTHVQKISLVK